MRCENGMVNWYKILPMAMAALAGDVPVAADAPRRLCVGDGHDSREGGEIWFGDNLAVLQTMETESVGLIYIDPPFNTGKVQSRKRIRVLRDDGGDDRDGGNNGAGARVGFGGRRYLSVVVGETGYGDSFGDYAGFLRPRLREAHRVLRAGGSLFFHIDWREAARCRLLLEEIFGGGAHCINEIIWAYDYGGRGKARWPAKHDNIYWFAKNPRDYVFNYDDIDRIPYMAPSLAGEEKAARGKTPTDTWWNTIVPTNGAEKAGYATQKPLAIVERIVRVHSKPDDIVLDFFAGSGTTGVAAAKNKRRFVLVDSNAQAISVMKTRLTGVFANCEKNNNKEKK